MPKKSRGTALRSAATALSDGAIRHPSASRGCSGGHLQTDLIGLDSTRLVAPLRESGRYTAFPGITPELDLEGARWVVRLQEMATVPAHELGEAIGTADHLCDEITRGIDILFHGF